MDIFEKKVYSLNDAMNFLNVSLSQLDEKISKSSSDESVLCDIRQEREQILSRQQCIKDFNRNPDLRHYYFALLSEIEANYIAAQAVASGSVSREKSGSYYFGCVVALILMVGELGSNIVHGAGYVADSYKNTVDKRNLLHIRDLSPTVEDFDQIALIIAVEITLKKREGIESLQRAVIPSDWKSMMKTVLTVDVDGMEIFLGDNQTQAKVLGRSDAFAIISYLQEEAVAENLNMDGDDSMSSKKSRHSVIADLILTEIYSRQEAKKPAPVVEGTVTASAPTKPKR